MNSATPRIRTPRRSGATRAAAPGARRIESAARRLFAARGYAGTSMAEVATAAGVSKATVFHHYGSKRELYDSLVGDAFAGFREQLVPLLEAEGDLEANLRAFVTAHVERLSRMQGTMRLIAREMLSGSAASGELMTGEQMSRNFSLLVEALRRGQSRGRVRDDVDPALAMFVVLCANWFLFQASTLARRNPDLAVTHSTADYAGALARLLCVGLAPPAPKDPP
jgi:TetR/AcrR family transcriptional regulator